MVDRCCSVSEAKVHPKLKDLKPLDGTFMDKFKVNCIVARPVPVICFRMISFRHSCNANAANFYISNLRVGVVFAERDIKAGEEIFVAYHNFKSISIDFTPEVIRYILLAQYRLVCPVDCACRDPVQIGQAQEAKEMKRVAFQLARQGKFKEAFEAAKDMIKFIENINLGIFQQSQAR
jgi:hypothetical protein